MDMALLGAFAISGLGFAVLPGADWGYAIATGVRGRGIWPAISGMVLGYVILTVATAFGVAALIASSPRALGIITLVGAAYLSWLGVQTLRSAHAASYAEAAGTPGSLRRMFAKGVATSGTNPKGLLLFVALLPQFVSLQAGWSASAQMLVLGFVFTITVAVIYTLVAFMSKRVVSQRPEFARYVSYASGVMMLVLAAVLVAEQLLG
ncbi:threonine/homoserine/homoserine lactone efflux protein [Leucobacter exalbidus]|uniref:Threonine/homoserine/homoserine lactone efflux protein n=1 Tax=Leucobacter exalbidus TaxID=662960 RepID=A0A940PUQ1_9MICO|nr:LysE family translocator [Leucobacter exalbidus]MBP1327178.1 threonine/homoserine/homoserine lactone efflux protein [Leucobacter exalbidus]